MFIMLIVLYVQIGYTGLPLRIIPVITSMVTMTVASFFYLPVVINGGVGKNGSTIAVSFFAHVACFHIVTVFVFVSIGDCQLGDG